MSISVVYWIRLLDHVDYKTQGYIGVSNNFNYRLHQHKTKTIKHDSHFGRSINKYGWDNLVKEIIFEGSNDECYNKENELRPLYNIGWNEAIGGLKRSNSKFIDYKNRINRGWIYDKNGINNPFYNKKHSDSSKLKISKNKCKSIITTPDGIFYGFNAVARFYTIHKLTAKKWALNKSNWSYENIK